jgi:hypothetical protein
LVFTLLRGCGYLLSEDVLHSREVFGCSEISIPSEARDLVTLRIVHFGIFDRSIVVTSKLLDSDLPMVKLPEKSVDFVVTGANLILRFSPVLNLLDFVDDVCRDLLPPFLTLIQVVNLANVP